MTTQWHPSLTRKILLHDTNSSFGGCESVPDPYSKLFKVLPASTLPHLYKIVGLGGYTDSKSNPEHSSVLGEMQTAKNGGTQKFCLSK